MLTNVTTFQFSPDASFSGHQKQEKYRKKEGGRKRNQESDRGGEESWNSKLASLFLFSISYLSNLSCIFSCIRTQKKKKNPNPKIKGKKKKERDIKRGGKRGRVGACLVTNFKSVHDIEAENASEDGARDNPYRSPPRRTQYHLPPFRVHWLFFSLCSRSQQEFYGLS